MAYLGYSFIFDGIPSDRFGLKFAAFNSSSFNYTSGSSVSLLTDKAPRSEKTSVYGVESEPLSFDIEMYAEEPLSPAQTSAVKSWLFGHQKYKKLSTLQPEYAGMYFNAILTSGEDMQILDGTNGLKITVTCDAGGGWKRSVSKTYTPASGGSIVISNQSASNEYVYPDVVVTATYGGTYAWSITNTTDSTTRSFGFSGLNTDEDGDAITGIAAATETFTINGETGQITTAIGTTTTHRLDKFSQNYLRLKRGSNTLVCSGPIASVQITYPVFVRIGG